MRSKHPSSDQNGPISCIASGNSAWSFLGEPLTFKQLLSGTSSPSPDPQQHTRRRGACSLPVQERGPIALRRRRYYCCCSPLSGEPLSQTTPHSTRHTSFGPRRYTRSMCEVVEKGQTDVAHRYTSKYCTHSGLYDYESQVLNPAVKDNRTIKESKAVRFKVERNTLNSPFKSMWREITV